MKFEFLNPLEKRSPKESSFLDKMENQLILARKLQNVYEHRPDPKNFIGAMADTKFASEYTKETIKENEKYVTETRHKIEEQNRSSGLENFQKQEGGFALSEMLQAMVVDQLNKKWLEEFKAIFKA